MRKTIFNLFIIIGTVFMLSSCVVFNAGKALVYMQKKKIKPQYVQFQEKSLIFVPIVHFGKEPFYNDLKDSIVHWKAKGYIVYYEQMIKSNEVMNLDSVSYDEAYRKTRRFLDLNGITREAYAEMMNGSPIKGIAQPDYDELGVDSTDLNVDVDIQELVMEYERLYGKIILGICDSVTHLDSAYHCGMLANSLNPLIHDFRNRKLVKKVKESEDQKIVILYGALHIKPMIKLLQEEE